MVLEGVVSLGENMIYVYAGERTAKEAVIDVSKNMAPEGVLSAVSGVIVSVAIALGAGPALASHGTGPGYDRGNCLLALGPYTDSRSISSGEFRGSEHG